MTWSLRMAMSRPAAPGRRVPVYDASYQRPSTYTAKQPVASSGPSIVPELEVGREQGAQGLRSDRPGDAAVEGQQPQPVERVDHAHDSRIGGLSGGTPHVEARGDAVVAVGDVVDAAARRGGVHYIADGHHRVAARLDVWRPPATRRRGPACASSTRSTGCGCWPSTAGSPAPSTATTLLTLLAADFERPRASTARTTATGCFGVYVDGRWYDASYTGTAARRRRTRRRDPPRPGARAPLGLDERRARLEIVSALSSARRAHRRRATTTAARSSPSGHRRWTS